MVLLDQLKQNASELDNHQQLVLVTISAAKRHHLLGHDTFIARQALYV